MAAAASRTTQLAIAGDGIAAEAMALAIAKAGRNVTLIGDGTSAPKGGVQLAPNAWAALDRLGVKPAALKKSRMLSSLRLVELSSGVGLADIPLNRTRARTPYAGIARAELVNILRRAADGTGRVARLKTRLEGIGEQSGKVRLDLREGKPLSSPWLIGCDGAAGVCRAFVEAGAGRKPLHARSAFRTVIGKDSCAPVPPGGMATTLWLGGGGHCVHYPLADGTVNLVVVVRASPKARENALALIGRQPLLARFSGAVEAAPELPLMDHGLLDAWQRDRVVLAGDAAHPMPPHLAQGAGQSLVDAGSFLEALSGSKQTDLQPLFTAWSATRARAIRDVSRNAEKAGRIFAMGEPAARLRNLGLSFVGDVVLGRLLDRIWAA